MDNYIRKSYGKNQMKEIYSSEDLARLIKDNCNYYENVGLIAQEALKKTRAEIKTEVEKEFEQKFKSLKKQLQFSYGHFESESECQMWEDFKTRHAKCYSNKYKIDNTKDFYVKAYGTPFGSGFIAVCPFCGKEEDITDMSNWE